MAHRCYTAALPGVVYTTPCDTTQRTIPEILVDASVHPSMHLMDPVDPEALRVHHTMWYSLRLRSIIHHYVLLLSCYHTCGIATAHTHRCTQPRHLGTHVPLSLVVYNILWMACTIHAIEISCAHQQVYTAEASWYSRTASSTGMCRYTVRCTYTYRYVAPCDTTQHNTRDVVLRIVHQYSTLGMVHHTATDICSGDVYAVVSLHPAYTKMH